MYKELIKTKRADCEKSIEHFKTELSAVRTGRASPALVEHIPVETYGSKTPLRNLASITVTDARTLTIQPWDKGILADVHKSLSSVNIGITPINDGNSIRLNLPPLNEERRKELVKLIKDQAETAKIRIRNIREDIWKEITRMLREKQLTEDQKFEAQDELKKFVEDYNKTINDLVEQKEKELITV